VYKKYKRKPWLCGPGFMYSPKEYRNLRHYLMWFDTSDGTIYIS